MIQIKNPCDADWKEMTLAESGKYCGACEKVVVDFTKMNDADIKNYFVRYKEQKTCGRFLTSQVNRPLKATAAVYSSTLWNTISRFPVFRFIILICTSTILWLSSCMNKDRTTGEIAVIGDSISLPIETDTITEIEDDSTIHAVGFIAPLVKGEAKIGQSTTMLELDSLIMGNFIVPDPDATLRIPALWPEETDTIIPIITGKVMMTDTISQKIKRKK